MRTTKQFQLSNSDFKKKLFHWAKQFDEIVWLDSNKYDHKYSDYDAVLAVEAFTAIKTDYVSAFEKLKEYQQQTADWIFGYLSYDLKNDTENLISANSDRLHFPDLYFFQPKKIFLLKGNVLEVHYLKMVDDEIDTDLDAIMNSELLHNSNPTVELPRIQSKISKEAYFSKVEKMLAHIQHGDIYEANFCMEFFIENARIDPFKIFQDLNSISKPPFAAFLKLENYFALSASPERYIKKSEEKIISQPIKGTAKRSKNPEEDNSLATNLATDEKERSENIMIVDLVRNDLSKTATKASVEVEELCRVYTFEQVHQLISTVVSKVEKTTSPVDILKSTFPMGSMTGAPKVSAMQIIEELEETKRSLYSGAIGYFKPPENGITADFDFNVVIRSILYNSENKYLSFSVGGAITAKSVPENEYEECLLKSEAMRNVLEM
ncbi:MAG TPA: anthranilate synthase component I family protein [Salinimicrobium sp.]|nr:anthranilate synthase component I family protein [Salinimicrobium sp.]